MNTRDEIQQILCDTIEKIAKKVVTRTSYTYLAKCKIVDIDPLENSYALDYRGQIYTGFGITGETYAVGDLVYVLFSNNDNNFKKMIMTRVGTFEDNTLRRTAMSALSGVSRLSAAVVGIEETLDSTNGNIESMSNSINNETSNYGTESIYFNGSSNTVTGHLNSLTMEKIKDAATIKINFVFNNKEGSKPISFKFNGTEILKWDDSEASINKLELTFTRQNKALNSWFAFGTLNGLTTSINKISNVSNLGNMTNFSFATISSNKIEQGVATIEAFI